MPKTVSTSTSYPKGSPARTTVKQSSTQPTFFGGSREVTSTTVNGVLTQQGTKVTSGGGGSAGGILGPLLMVGGVFLLWIAFRGKSRAMWDAITGDSGFDVRLDNWANAINPQSSSGGGGGGNKSGAPVTGNTTDSGTHMGIDSLGNIITINKDYGSMSDAEKDAANNYAHQIGNIG